MSLTLMIKKHILQWYLTRKNAREVMNLLRFMKD